MIVEHSDSKTIYAFGTRVNVSQSIEEIRKLLTKHGAQGFAHVISPAGEAYLAFLIKTRIGQVQVRITVPRVQLKHRYLEAESYRAALLIIKSKFTEIECGEPADLVFLPNMPTKQREMLLPHVPDTPLNEIKEDE